MNVSPANLLRGPGGYRLLRLAVVLLVTSGGCRSAHYRAANMPAELLAPSSAGSQTVDLARLSGVAGGSSRLAAGDLLHLTLVSGIEDGEVRPQSGRIADDGTVNVPLVGPVPVARIDEQQAAERIHAAAIERGIYRNPQVTVSVAERAVNHVTVLGAVVSPGTHQLPRGASNLVAAIAAAGGLTEEAGPEIEVLRQAPNLLAAGKPAGESAIQLASFSAPGRANTGPRTERIDLASNTPLQPRDLRLGDQDVVMIHTQAKRVVHVSGLVRQPKQIELPHNQDLHVLDAIAMAGDKSSPVADKVYVIRRLDETSEPKVIQLSIAEAKVNGKENLRLAPGDMVSVEATIMTGVVDTLSSIFRITAGVGGNVLSF